MAIIYSNDDGGLGRAKDDAKRHREKQREAIKKNLPQINEAIITKKRKGTVKIPIRSIDLPDFRPAKKDDGGIGQGSGDPGDVIDRRPSKTGKGPGKAGNAPGEDYIETEVEITEVIEMIFEDLGLPNLEKKEEKNLIVELGYKLKGRSKSGSWALLDRRTTVREGMRRFLIFMETLKKETNLPEFVCFSALKKAKGGVKEALEFLKDPDFKAREKKVVPFPIFSNDDLRFRKLEPDYQYESQAVIFAMMDVSGSMSDDKKYIARSMLFWLAEFLRKIYENVEIRFIIYHSAAKIVEEEMFFKTAESGGTCCYTAYEIANDLIDTEYPPGSWNIYLWHFSDGDDFNLDRGLKEMRKILARGINMLSYGEIKLSNDIFSIYNDSGLMSEIKKYFKTESTNEDLEMIVGVDKPLLGVVIKKKEDIFPALKKFLDKRRWSRG